MIADNGYSRRAIASTCVGARIPAAIPDHVDQRDTRHRGWAGGRPPAPDPGVYPRRDEVACCVSRLEQGRALATGYAEIVTSYRRMVDLATLLIRLGGQAPGPLRPGGADNCAGS
ncbi:Transposase DDE domain-containing protein [Streptoalloteichus tenebrarius]|uniref:Transposase DDE domain-containing protein n=1 Tax=Streptoalloteichus tenebrarius (strain ATCC 17920 / DSM 40477 / JCM 4838 / CBS 697.72 / NBRC 16177 / NCIMB 11028 / NRRL B-12390 / A12253. 1 / ISP 5477) TaxID=1933 RepID=A0ABT1I2B6_STRSD|nr:hypothetical protein [Streptoalloteichus tenebrarius]MCP2261866.1 Transposase DDE domain-containing protein [Streptoalloteichus tenebrarius]BFF00014.1 hypothetical protein GCM10020241_16890 [Streptoalloteichus tenebrarius]